MTTTFRQKNPDCCSWKCRAFSDILEKYQWKQGKWGCRSQCLEILEQTLVGREEIGTVF